MRSVPDASAWRYRSGMRKTKTKTTKLNVNLQTVRRLGTQDLDRVAGAGEVEGSLNCTATYPGCHSPD